MTKRVVVTGMSVNTVLGDTLETFHDGLLAGRSAISRWKAFPTDRCHSKVGGDLSHYDVAGKVDALQAKLPAEVHKRLRKLVTRVPWTTGLSMLLAVDGWLDAGLFDADYDPHRQAVVISGHNLNALYQHDTRVQFEEEPNLIGLQSSLYSLDTGHAGCVSEVLQTRGPIYTIGAACASGNVAMRSAVDEIRHHGAQVAMVVGAVLEFAPVDVHAMALMGAIAIESFNDTPALASRPYDTRRDGFVMAEGGATLVLEEWSRAARRGARIYAEVAGYATTRRLPHDGAAPDGRRRPRHHAGPGRRRAARGRSTTSTRTPPRRCSTIRSSASSGRRSVHTPTKSRQRPKGLHGHALGRDRRDAVARSRWRGHLPGTVQPDQRIPHGPRHLPPGGRDVPARYLVEELLRLWRHQLRQPLAQVRRMNERICMTREDVLAVVTGISPRSWTGSTRPRSIRHDRWRTMAPTASICSTSFRARCTRWTSKCRVRAEPPGHDRRAGDPASQHQVRHRDASVDSSGSGKDWPSAGAAMNGTGAGLALWSAIFAGALGVVYAGFALGVNGEIAVAAVTVAVAFLLALERVGPEQRAWRRPTASGGTTSDTCSSGLRSARSAAPGWRGGGAGAGVASGRLAWPSSSRPRWGSSWRSSSATGSTARRIAFPRSGTARAAPQHGADDVLQDDADSRHRHRQLHVPLDCAAAGAGRAAAGGALGHRLRQFRRADPARQRPAADPCVAQRRGRHARRALAAPLARQARGRQQLRDERDALGSRLRHVSAAASAPRVTLGIDPDHVPPTFLGQLLLPWRTVRDLTTRS